MMKWNIFPTRSDSGGAADWAGAWRSEPSSHLLSCHSLPAGCCHCVIMHHTANVSPVSQPLSTLSSLGVPAFIHRQSTNHLSAGGRERWGGGGGEGDVDFFKLTHSQCFSCWHAHACTQSYSCGISFVAFHDVQLISWYDTTSCCVSSNILIWSSYCTCDAQPCLEQPHQHFTAM